MYALKERNVNTVIDKRGVRQSKKFAVLYTSSGNFKTEDANSAIVSNS